MIKNKIEPEKETKLLKLWKHIDKIVASSTIVLVFVFGGFYFSTNYTLSQHTTQIGNINSTMKTMNEKITNNSLAPMVTQQQINGLKDLIIEIKEHQQQSDLRQDKIYDILLDIKSNQKK